MMSKPIAPTLLLGGRGFIGQAVARRLTTLGVPTLVVGRGDLPQLPEALRRSGVVIHLASSTTPGSSAHNPLLEDANLTLTKAVTELIEPLPPKHLVFFSSGGTVYGNPEHLPVSESAPLRPLSPYGRGKVLQENMCMSLRTHGHAVTVLRPSNVYGPGQTGRQGFGLIPAILSAIRQKNPIDVWGDGESVRDYVHIDDLVEATLCVISRPDLAGIFNVASGTGHSVNDVIRYVEQAAAQSVAVRFKPMRDADVRAVVLDTTKFSDTFGWSASIALPSGLRGIL